MYPFYNIQIHLRIFLDIKYFIFHEEKVHRVQINQVFQVIKKKLVNPKGHFSVFINDLDSSIWYQLQSLVFMYHAGPSKIL